MAQVEIIGESGWSNTNVSDYEGNFTQKLKEREDKTQRQSTKQHETET